MNYHTIVLHLIREEYEFHGFGRTWNQILQTWPWFEYFLGHRVTQQPALTQWMVFRYFSNSGELRIFTHRNIQLDEYQNEIEDKTQNKLQTF